MAGRIRSIKPEILDDEKCAALSHLEFRLFVGSWLIADDYGNLRGEPDYVRGQIVWSSRESRETVANALESLARASLLVPYRVRGQSYLHISGWEKHQKVDKPGKPRMPGITESDHEDTYSSRDPGKSSRESRESLAPDLRSPTSDLDHESPDPVLEGKILPAKSPQGSCSDAPAIPPAQATLGTSKTPQASPPPAVTPKYRSEQIRQILQDPELKPFVDPMKVIAELGYNIRQSALQNPAVEPPKPKPVPVERPSEFIRSTADLFAELPFLQDLVKPDPEPEPPTSPESPESAPEAIPPNDAAPPSKVEPAPTQVANQTGLSGRRHPSGAGKQMAHELLSLIVKNHPTSKLAIGNERLREDTRLRWGLTFDKINHIGLMTWEQIRVVMTWSQKDDYWRDKVLGADNLWDNWDKIIADKGSRRRNAKGANPTGDAMREYEELLAQEKRAAAGGQK